MLLVLTVLLGMLALSWPSLSRIQAHHQLRQSAELVQLQMLSARVQALDQGVTYQFCFEPGGRRFVILPFDIDSGELQTATASSGTLNAASTFDADHWGTTGRIPENLLSRLADAGQLRGISWAGPLLFRPDGTASSSPPVIVRNSPLGAVSLTVEPLTGGVTLAGVEQ